MYSYLCFFFNDTATTEIYTYLHTLSLHDALPISAAIAIETPSALVRRKRAARREDDFISGTPLNISLFLLPGEHNSIARPIQPEAPICVIFEKVMLFGHRRKSACSTGLSSPPAEGVGLP